MIALDLIRAAYFVEIFDHHGKHSTRAFATKQEAQVFLRLIPVMQADGEWTHIHRAILRASFLTLN